MLDYNAIFKIKGINKESITLVEKRETLLSSKTNFWNFEYFLFWCSKKLWHSTIRSPIVDTIDISDSLLTAITICKNHPSITLIKYTFKNLDTFSFHYVDESDTEKEITNLNNSKPSQDSVTPFRINKDNLDVF